MKVNLGIWFLFIWFVAMILLTFCPKWIAYLVISLFGLLWYISDRKKE